MARFELDSVGKKLFYTDNALLGMKIIGLLGKHNYRASRAYAKHRYATIKLANYVRQFKKWLLTQSKRVQKELGDWLREQQRDDAKLLRKSSSRVLNRNSTLVGTKHQTFHKRVNARPIKINRTARVISVSTDSGGGPDEPDPDPDPERPYIALGIDHKADTPAGPPVPVSLRLFSLYRIEMRYCHEGNRTDHPEP